MIACATGPLDAAPESLHALYVSLNSPVVSVARLPVGPATAAIAVHGGAGTTLLIRSLRTGTVAFFHAEPRLGLEAALAHAEGLGFLFDDEANLGRPGVQRPDWPHWLLDVFASAAEPDPSYEPGAWLSKFRWHLAAEAAGEGRREHGGRL